MSTRDFAAEMRAVIEAEAAGGPYVSAVVAAHIVDKLRATDPELLDGWLQAGAVQFLRHAISQRFVHTWRGSGIQMEEYVTDAKLAFTVTTDHDFSTEEWALLWLTGEQQGIGATRSQGYGRYEVTRWERLK